jgi:hypothetical protein
MSDARPLAAAGRCLILALACVLTLGLFPSVGAAVDWKERTTRYVVLFHLPEHANTAEQLAGMIDPVVEQMAALHDYTPRRPLVVRLYGNVESYAESSDLARTPYGQVAQASRQPAELALAEPRLRNLAPEQVRNLFRRGLSQLMLDDQTRGQLPVGLLQGVAQYSEQSAAEVEVGARLLDKARLERGMLSWSELNTAERFAAQAEVAGAQGYAVVAFLLDRYGLAPWQRFLNGVRTAPNYEIALAQAYGKPAATLEAEWQGYLGEYFGGSYRINHFQRYDLGIARGHLQAGRYYEAGEELTAMARFVAGAGRVAKETEIREVAKQVETATEGGALLNQGQVQLAAFQYTAARDSFAQARQRYEAIGATPRIEEVDKAIATADSGIVALDQLAEAQRLLAEVKYGEAQTAALAAGKTFAELGDEEHYRQSWMILQDLYTTQTRVAYLLAVLGVLLVLWSFWRLHQQARRSMVPGVLQ